MKKVRVTKTDGRYTKTPWGCNLYNPLTMVVPPGARVPLKLGVQFDRPCLGWLSPSVAELGLVGDGGLHMFAENEQVVVWLKNETNKDVMLQEKTSILRIFPLDGSDVEFEG